MKNIYKLLIFSAFIALLVYLDTILPFNLLHSYRWYLWGFFAFQGLLTMRISGNGLEQDSQNFHFYFFSSMLLRMLLCVAVIFGVVYKGVDEPLRFILSFFSLYFLFLTFEIYILFTNLRPKSKKYV
jgi:hypothetical protein